MKPFADVTVIEVGKIVSAPTTGKVLSSLGADVIKIEQPDAGDPYRYLTPGNFEFLNHGKLSIGLDLKSDSGKAVFEDLLAEADLLVENLSPGAFKRLDLSLDRLANTHDVVVVSVKGYGEGPYAHRVAMDYSVENETGILYMTGLEDQPLRVGFSVVDLVTGLFGVISALFALSMPDSPPEVITVGMFETAAFLMGQHVSYSSATGEERVPFNERGFDWAVYGNFTTSDDEEVFIGLVNDAQWGRFVDKFDIEKFQNDERFSDRERRMNSEEYINEIVAEVVGRHRLEDILKKLKSLEIPYSPFQTPQDLLKDDHLVDKNKFVDVERDGQEIRVPSLPIDGLRFDGEVARSPKVGEQTDKILRSVGYADADVDRLKTDGAVYSETSKSD